MVNQLITGCLALPSAGPHQPPGPCLSPTLSHQFLHLPHSLDGTGLGRHTLDGAQRHAQCLQRELAKRAELIHVGGQVP